MKTTKTFLIALFFISMNFADVYSQRNIRGRVINDDLEVSRFAHIFEFNNEKRYGFDARNLLGRADWDGFFDITIPNEINKLIFTSLGVNAVIELSDNCDYMEIILLLDAAFIGSPSIQEIERRERERRRVFDNLPQLHLEAVRKGIFKNETICHSRIFWSEMERIDEINRQRREREREIREINRQVRRDFRRLSVGDTIQIPFRAQWNRTIRRTTLFPICNQTDVEYFSCIVEGVVIGKFRQRYHNGVSVRGRFLTIRVTNIENCQYDSSELYGRLLRVGNRVGHNMTRDKVIIR